MFMKKRLVSLLAILLVLATAIAFTACGKATVDNETVTSANAADPQSGNSDELTTSEEVLTEDVVASTATEAATTEVTMEATTEATTEAPTTTAPEGVPNPVGMSQAQIVSWYNDRVNYVREKKPAITITDTQKIDKITTTVLGGAADKIVTNIVEKKMPGIPETKTISKGAGNQSEFFANTAQSNIKSSDVSSATAKKEGGNYVVTLKLGNETNPGKDGASKYSRMFVIATRQDVLDDLKDTVTGSVDRTTMVYRDGRATITVNEKGEIIKADGIFYVDVDSKEVKASIIKTDIVAYQHTSCEYKNFVY
jgi:hypothetical protein